MEDRYLNDDPCPGKDGILGFPQVRVAGVPIVARPAEEVVECIRLVAATLSNTGVAVHFVNAYTISLTEARAYLDLFQRGSVNFADGTPLAWLARRRSTHVAHMRGPDAFRSLLGSAPEAGLRHFLLGGTEQSLARLESTIAREYPDASIVGSFSPPFRPLDQSDHQEIDARLTQSGANVVWVGIGTPKQDYEVARIATEHPAVVLAVGAAFNFVSGDVVEAPVLWRRTGLEWAYRFVREPRRLWRRYVFGNLRFVMLAMRRNRG